MAKKSTAKKSTAKKPTAKKSTVRKVSTRKTSTRRTAKKSAPRSRRVEPIPTISRTQLVSTISATPTPDVPETVRTVMPAPAPTPVSTSLAVRTGYAVFGDYEGEVDWDDYLDCGRTLQEAIDDAETRAQENCEEDTATYYVVQVVRVVVARRAEVSVTTTEVAGEGPA